MPLTSGRIVVLKEYAKFGGAEQVEQRGGNLLTEQRPSDGKADECVGVGDLEDFLLETIGKNPNVVMDDVWVFWWVVVDFFEFICSASAGVIGFKVFESASVRFPP